MNTTIPAEVAAVLAEWRDAADRHRKAYATAGGSDLPGKDPAQMQFDAAVVLERCAAAIESALTAQASAVAPKIIGYLPEGSNTVTPIYAAPKDRQPGEVCIVCDWTDASPLPRFVEVEIDGQSVCFGWRDRGNGIKEIVIPAQLPAVPVESLTADCTRLLPGKMDDTTYQQIENALDLAAAPMRSASGKWLTLYERVAAIKPVESPASVPDGLRSLYAAAAKGFHVSRTCDSDKKYHYVSEFRNIDDLHAYQSAWTAAMGFVRDAQPTNQEGAAP